MAVKARHRSTLNIDVRFRCSDPACSGISEGGQ